MKHNLLTKLSELFNSLRGRVPPPFDKFWVQFEYILFLRRRINWSHPRTYTEKLNIYKISPQAEKKWRLVDKYAARSWVAKKIGRRYLIPLIGIYQNPGKIEWDKLPNQFAIKATHGSGWTIICRDKDRFDRLAAIKRLNKWLRRNYYREHKEKQYKLAKPRIIIEKYLSDNNSDPYDYKFYCFDDQVKMIQVDLDRYTNHTQNFYTPKWRKIPMTRVFPSFQKKVKRPKNLKQMLKIASILSAGLPHVRVDLYNIDGKIYFGEMTFTSFAGVSAFKPKKYDFIFGKYFKL